ncbi:hypothetical protein Tco_0454504 [Tanacetum coccineum]
MLPKLVVWPNMSDHFWTLVTTYEDDKAVRQMIIDARALKVYANQSMSDGDIMSIDITVYLNVIMVIHQRHILCRNVDEATKRLVKALQKKFTTLFYSANTSFDALLVSLLSTAKSSHQSAGIAKQALFSITQCVVVLCLATEDYNCSSTGEEDRLEWQNRLRKLQNIILGGSSHPPST